VEVPVKFQGIWWEEMKLHVREKMDEHQKSNCGTSVKKDFLVSSHVSFIASCEQRYLSHYSLVCTLS